MPVPVTSWFFAVPGGVVALNGDTDIFFWFVFAAHWVFIFFVWPFLVHSNGSMANTWRTMGVTNSWLGSTADLTRR